MNSRPAARETREARLTQPRAKVATDPKITARRYDSDKGSVSFIVFVFPIRYSIKAAQQDSAFKMTHI